MLKLPKPAAIAMQATLGITLSAPWAVSALAAPATQSQTTPRLQEGDLVRLRSGGPEMTIKSVRGNWVIAIWWNEVFGGFQSAGWCYPGWSYRRERPSPRRFEQRRTAQSESHRAEYQPNKAGETGQRDYVREPFDEARAGLTIATGRRTIATGHRYQSVNWRSAAEARASITIATGHHAQSDGITIATGHQCQSDNWRSAGEARAGIATGHRPDGITITIATRHRYQSDDWRWAGQASQRGHVNARSGCDR